MFNLPNAHCALSLPDRLDVIALLKQGNESLQQME